MDAYIFLKNTFKNQELVEVYDEIAKNAQNDTWVFDKNNNSQSSQKGTYRWKRVPKNSSVINGNVVGSSSEAYVNEEDCIKNAIRHGYNHDCKTIVNY